MVVSIEEIARIKFRAGISLLYQIYGVYVSGVYYLGICPISVC